MHVRIGDVDIAVKHPDVYIEVVNPWRGLAEGDSRERSPRHAMLYRMLSSDLTAALDAASRATGRHLTFVRELTGGQHADTVLTRDETTHFVVRLFPPNDDAPSSEVAILERIRSLDGLVPAFVALSHVENGRQMIVTSAIPGTAPDPTVPLHRIAEQMGAILARIHELDGTGLRSAPTAAPDGSSPLAVRAHRAWAGLDLTSPVLTHYDFWSGNTLWDGIRLTGVVDWSGARSAPRGVDVAWARQDLILLGSMSAADRLLDVYQRAARAEVTDISAWDLLAAAQADPVVETWTANYAGVGRPELTPAVLRSRLDAWIGTLLR